MKRDNQPVKDWSVLQAVKNRHLLLVQVERNWFVLDLKQERAYRVARSDFQTRDADLWGPEPDRHTPVLKTYGWDSQNIGPAQQVTVRLAKTSDAITIELPHPVGWY